MSEPAVPVTSALMWNAALVVAAFDLALGLILVRTISRARFRALFPALVPLALLYWCGLYTYMMWSAWDWCYSLIFPDWFYGWIPVLGLGEGLLGLVFWWIALRLPAPPVASFLVLGGLQSLPGHLSAIYRMGMFDKVRVLQGVSPASALVFGIFEFMCYWIAVLGLAALLSRGLDHFKRPPLTAAPAGSG